VKLDAIAGQPRAVEQLSRASRGRVGARLRVRGTGGRRALHTALAFASELLGADVTRGHPDLHVVTPTPPESNPKGARTIRIGAIRELERRASLRPALAARRVLILDEADRMTTTRPQAFLKFPRGAAARHHRDPVLSRARAVPATVFSRARSSSSGRAASLRRREMVAKARRGSRRRAPRA